MADLQASVGVGFDGCFLGLSYRCPFIVTAAHLQIENRNPPVFEQFYNKLERIVTSAFYHKMCSNDRKHVVGQFYPWWEIY